MGENKPIQKKIEIMRNYDSSAAAYDRQYIEEQNEKIRTVLDNLNLDKISLALDDGCGTGLLFTHLQEFVEYLVGLDFSLDLLKRAKKRAKSFPKVDIVRADADHLPFLEQIFDAALAITLLQNMPSPIDTLQEMKRVCKTGSIIAVTGLKKLFPLDEFESLLDQTRLKISTIKNKEKSKDYVAICRRP